MKHSIIILITIAFTSAKVHEKFEKFQQKFNKNYNHLPENVQLRREANFLKNLELIEMHNKDPKNEFKLGLNKYSDYDREQFVKDMCGTKIPLIRKFNSPLVIPKPKVAANESADWRYLTQPIKNQGLCGACWAFTAVSLIESMNKRNNIFDHGLSEQNIVDCDMTNFGCNGGWPPTTFEFLKYAYGNKLAKATDYPYTSFYANTTDQCRKVQSYTALNINGIYDMDIKSEDELKAYVSYYGPVGIAMWVSNAGLFQNYQSGIFYDPTCTVTTGSQNQCGMVNHGMTVVGYGKDENGTPYWLVRNSWGTSWGEQGYIRMAMNRGNNCNIACYAFGAI